MKGYIQVYYGDEKGGTIAALGLSLRAAGAGFKVFIARFNQKDDDKDMNALKRFADLITVEHTAKPDSSIRHHYLEVDK